MQSTEYGGRDSVTSEVGHIKHYNFHCGLLDHFLWDNQPPCCEATQTALWRGPHYEALDLPINSQPLPATGMADPPASEAFS